MDEKKKTPVRIRATMRGRAMAKAIEHGLIRLVEDGSGYDITDFQGFWTAIESEVIPASFDEILQIIDQRGGAGDQGKEPAKQRGQKRSDKHLRPTATRLTLFCLLSFLLGLLVAYGIACLFPALLRP